MENALPQPLQIKPIKPLPHVTGEKTFFTPKTTLLALSILVTLSLTAGTYSLIASSNQTPVAKPREPILLTLPPLQTSVDTQPTATPTLIPSPTASRTETPTPQNAWKNYNNILYGYSIDYPPDWGVADLGILEPLVPSYVVFNANTATTSARFISISISTRTYEDQLTFGASTSAITVAGVTGAKQSFKDSDGNTSTAIILPRTNNLLILRAKTAYLPIFNQMLTTLTITD